VYDRLNLGDIQTSCSHIYRGGQGKREVNEEVGKSDGAGEKVTEGRKKTLHAAA
jgi:hypothetical protein